ncbi:hypothetical protein IQ254_02290 [Nodosilinea sp. LEGE 07088]|uniref:hypothetical protein n=1 Tax=Nodosilinea sp. LEGE 07088 TaxID=2777968 RepID=UPI0018828C3C|nr:hypothetical protein [Nodosilinea sp. LEGE 07088]MBE9136041.1 hypothetical protein [Nodosilinea sp. LEGE 07088]
MPLRLFLRPRAPKVNSPGPVQVWVGGRPSRLWRWLGPPLVLCGLGGGLALLVLSFRLGLRLMLDPQAVPQGWARLQSQSVSLPPATTLDELRRQAAAEQQQLGVPLPVQGKSGWQVLPLLEADTGAIAALTLYQTQPGPGGSDDEWRAIATLTVDPLPRATVLAPWHSSPQAPTALPTTLPLTKIAPLPPAASASGTWFTLEGIWQEQGLALRYGHLLYIDPQTPQLDLLASWSSPTNRPPQWVDLDGQAPSDLVVDETVGLDPALRGIQVLAGTTPRLQPVSWLRMPVDAGAQAVAYQRALRSARGGLWHPAKTQLAGLKASLGQNWTPAAEAQLRLMERHAAITSQQAGQDWSTPTQQMLALVIDGRWDGALAILEANPDLLPAVIKRLEADQGRLWNRISAAAALPNPDPAVYVWGGLALRARPAQPDRRDGADQDWLNRQSVPTAARQRLTAVLAALSRAEQPAVARVKTATEASTTEASEGGAAIALPPLKAIIGQARPIAAPSSGYAAPGQALDASLGQWYAIELRAINQGRTWQSGGLVIPSGAAPAAVWPAIQPVAQASPQLLQWVSPTTGVAAPITLRGLQLTDGIATLLATGPPANEAALPPLIFSQGALMWLAAGQRQQPESAVVAAAVELAIFDRQPAPASLMDVLDELSQHSLDLTGDGQPERVLTWNQAALNQLKTWGVSVDQNSSKTIILSSNGTVLYSDILASQTLVALTSPAPGSPVELLVYGSGGYQLLSWAAAAQRFE